MGLVARMVLFLTLSRHACVGVRNLRCMDRLSYVLWLNRLPLNVVTRLMVALLGTRERLITTGALLSCLPGVGTAEYTSEWAGYRYAWMM